MSTRSELALSGVSDRMRMAVTEAVTKACVLQATRLDCIDARLPLPCTPGRWQARRAKICKLGALTCGTRPTAALV
eukprot:2844246-Prymnesium_polylepis.1